MSVASVDVGAPIETEPVAPPPAQVTPPTARPSAAPGPAMAGKTGRLARMARFIAYPIFYLFCLGVFGYVSFPYDLLKARLIAEFDKSQQKKRKPGEEPMRLEIDELDSHWFTGVEITGARLVIPPKPKKAKKKSLTDLASDTAAAAPPAPSVVKIDEATARVRLWPLLFGDVIVDFTASAFGGEIEGTVPFGEADEGIELALENVSLLDIQPLQALLDGVPLQGVLSGNVRLTPKGGKLAASDGSVSLQLDGLKLGKMSKDEEGKPIDVVEIQKVELPSVALGSLAIEATAKDGTLKFTEFAIKSADFELLGEGNIKLNEAWDRSKVEMFLKFKFTDAYRERVSDKSSALLGKPGETAPALIDLEPKFKDAKTDDGYWRFRVHGTLANLDFDPAGTRSGARKTSRAGRRPTSPIAPRAGGEEGEGDTEEPTKPSPVGRRPTTPRRGRPQPDEPPTVYEAPTPPAAPDPAPDEPPGDGTGDAPEPEGAEPEQPAEEAPADEGG